MAKNPNSKFVTATRAMAVRGEHIEAGTVLAVPDDIDEADAKYLVDGGALLEGDFADLYSAPAAPAAEKAGK